MTSPPRTRRRGVLPRAPTTSACRRTRCYFFQQGTMPAARPGHRPAAARSAGPAVPRARTATAARSPPWPTAACSTSCTRRGVKHVFYFQVDNPLVKIADPAFLGRHIARPVRGVVEGDAKDDPEEKVGVLALIDGRCSIIEYSDLPDELAASSGRPTASSRSAPATPPSTCSTSTFLRAGDAGGDAGCRSTSPARRCRTSTRPGGRSTRRRRTR